MKINGRNCGRGVGEHDVPGDPCPVCEKGGANPCQCGELEQLTIEHEEGHGMRMTCQCGICGPWERTFEHCYASWNQLVSTERRT